MKTFSLLGPFARALRRLLADRRGDAIINQSLMTAIGCGCICVAAPSMYENSQVACSTMHKQVSVLHDAGSPGGDSVSGSSGFDLGRVVNTVGQIASAVSTVSSALGGRGSNISGIAGAISNAVGSLAGSQPATVTGTGVINTGGSGTITSAQQTQTAAARTEAIARATQQM